MKLEKLEASVMKQAIRAYRSITATPEFREMERVRSKARHDEAQALRKARLDGAESERGQWQSVVAGKDAMLADKDAMLADKDAMLADKDAIIARLRAELDEVKK